MELEFQWNSVPALRVTADCDGREQSVPREPFDHPAGVVLRGLRLRMSCSVFTSHLFRLSSFYYFLLCGLKRFVEHHSMFLEL